MAKIKPVLQQSQKADKLLMVFGIIAVLFVLVLLLLFVLGKQAPKTIQAQTNLTTVTAINQTATPTPTSASGGLGLKTPVNIADKPIYGVTNPKVLLVVFDDFQCPFCARFHPSVKQALVDYPTSLGLVIKNFPISTIHPNARKAAEAYECSLDQGKEFGLRMADTLFLSQSDLSDSALKSYAKNIGLDPIKFDACFASGVKASIVEKDYQEGISLGVSGTPTAFVNDRKIVGAQPYSILKQVIDLELAKS